MLYNGCFINSTKKILEDFAIQIEHHTVQKRLQLRK